MRLKPACLQDLIHMLVLHQNINSILMGSLLPLLLTFRTTQAKKGSCQKTLCVDMQVASRSLQCDNRPVQSKHQQKQPNKNKENVKLG